MPVQSNNKQQIHGEVIVVVSSKITFVKGYEMSTADCQDNDEIHGYCGLLIVFAECN